ncbi:MAG: metallophosphoesterase [Planctomycetota bacterium]
MSAETSHPPRPDPSAICHPPSAIGLTRIALIGDLHLFSLWPMPWHMLSKRVLGQSNLWLNRRKVFRHHRLHELIDKAIDLKPDMVLCSGDLTTTALQSEFETARRFLAPLAEVAPLVAVPGNHDKYTFTAARSKRMQRMLPGWVPDTFPHTRPINAGWDLLALDAAIPRVKDAVGRLGAQQLDSVAATLRGRDPARGLVVLCHYPCVVPHGIHEHDSHRLADAPQLRKLLEQHTDAGARVVYIHGHIHRPWYVQPGADPDRGGDANGGVPFTCINAGAPCMVDPDHPLGQGFGELILPDDPAASLVVRRHMLD